MTDDLTAAEREQFEAMAERWGRFDRCVDYLLQRTSLADRTEALLFLVLCNAEAWAVGIERQNERQDEIQPRVKKLIEWMEQERDRGEDWKE